MTVTIIIAALLISGLITLALVKGIMKNRNKEIKKFQVSPLHDDLSVISWDLMVPTRDEKVIVEPVIKSPKVKGSISVEKKAKKSTEKAKVKDKAKTKAEPKSKKEAKKEDKPTKKFEKKTAKKKDSPKKPGKGDRLLLS
jgi:hypothetical protein